MKSQVMLHFNITIHVITIGKISTNFNSKLKLGRDKATRGFERERSVSEQVPAGQRTAIKASLSSHWAVIHIFNLLFPESALSAEGQRSESITFSTRLLEFQMIYFKMKHTLTFFPVIVWATRRRTASYPAVTYGLRQAFQTVENANTIAESEVSEQMALTKNRVIMDVKWK